MRNNSLSLVLGGKDFFSVISVHDASKVQFEFSQSVSNLGQSIAS